jgi:lipoyl(octanoyl) transferase
MKFINIPGLIDYNEIITILDNHVDRLIKKETNEIIYLTEHHDVYTAGYNAKNSELLTNNFNIPVIYTNRGGKFTYHGPGQRIIYPIIDLSIRINDIRLYVRMLEEWIINSLNYLGIDAKILDGKVGIWVIHNKEFKKIASIGLRVKKSIVYHGVAVNISTDLKKFSGIIPCGLDNIQFTSLKELTIDISMSLFDNILKSQFYRVFGK